VSRPRLDLVSAPAEARDVVLLAHGGQEASRADPHDWRAPLLRMWPFAAAARSAAPGAAVGLIRYRYRGWNGEYAHAAADLAAVLDSLPDEYRRVALIGHSMGARAVLRVGDHDRDTAVLGLAPWVEKADALVDLPGRVVVLAHGDRDRITSPKATARYAAQLRSAGNSVAHLTVAGEGHALLRRHGDWDELVRRFVALAFGRGDGFLGDVLSSDPGRPADPLPRWSTARGSARGVTRIARARLRLPVLTTVGMVEPRPT
jgi:predicted esterase